MSDKAKEARHRTTLAQWRGVWEERPLPDRTAHVSDALHSVMKKFGLSERLRETEMVDAWQGIVGDFLAQHSKPDSLKAGVLYVKVLQPTVHYELDRVHKPRILNEMKCRFGARNIRDIRFRLS